ncbi:MAG TPA: hypothetical protein VHW47_00425, partial [Acidimicrobiales bacterium]|nr:hypothetical protein [Acidimicrobiales bacterium]
MSTHETTEPTAADRRTPGKRRRLNRYSGAAVIAVGGAACTAAGALFGGLGAGTAVAPAAVQSLLTSDTPSLPAGSLPDLPGALPPLPGGLPSFPSAPGGGGRLVANVSGS